MCSQPITKVLFRLFVDPYDLVVKAKDGKFQLEFLAISLFIEKNFETAKNVMMNTNVLLKKLTKSATKCYLNLNEKERGKMEYYFFQKEDSKGTRT